MIFYQLLQEAEVLKFIMKCPHFVDKKSHKGSLTSKSPNAKLREWVSENIKFSIKIEILKQFNKRLLLPELY